MSDYPRMRSLQEARAVVAYLDAVQRRPIVVPSSHELAQERTTLRLRDEFLRVDILKIHDDWSLSGDTRTARPLRPRGRRAAA